MKKTHIFKCLVASIALFAAGNAFACSSGTYGLGVQGAAEGNYWVNVYAGNGEYNQTMEVKANQYQEFCWANDLGQASVTKTDESQKCSAYDWKVPDTNVGYKTIYIDSGNWNKSC